jgi:hypothetical protein
MERLSIVLAAAVALASNAWAQEGAERTAPPPGAAQQVEVSDADLETFADIYVDLLATADKFEQQLAGAQTEEEAEEVQAQMASESTEKVARRGWTPEHFVAVGEAINANQELAAKTLALIQDRI